MRAPVIPVFRLRFPVVVVPQWAAASAYADDATVEAIGVTARMRGFYTRDEFLAVARWKTNRSMSRCARNSATLVEETTAAALRASDERLRIGTLTLLEGVSMPTASVLLHLAHKDPYPIIDYRALWSLGIETPPPSYSFEFWQAYTRTCRSLAKQAGVSMRLLDRALWQFSKEQQPAPAPASAARLKPQRTPTSPPPQRTKSATMRGLFEDGWTVAQVAKALKVNNAFAYSVHRRWQESKQRQG